MDDLFSPHRTIPHTVQISEPLTFGNRGAIARWCEDHGVAVAVPWDAGDDALIVGTRTGDRVAAYADRIVLEAVGADVIDHAHYKLWYEPVD